MSYSPKIDTINCRLKLSFSSSPSSVLPTLPTYWLLVPPIQDQFWLCVRWKCLYNNSNTNNNLCIYVTTSLSLSSRPSSSEGWRQQLSIPVSSSSIALRPLTFPLAECTCTPSNLLCRWSIVFLVCLDNVFLPCFLRVQSVLAVRPTALLMQCFT